MSITTTVPTNKRKPGTYQEFDVTSGARGLVPVNYTIALVAAKLVTGTRSVLVPTLVTSDSEADTFFGAGSELAMMCRAAFKAGKKYGNQPAIYAVGITDATGTAATRTLTVTGTATQAGDVEFKIAGRTIRAAVNVGDAFGLVAASIKTAIDNRQNVEPLPCTAGVAAGVVTTTARQLGVNGNDLKVSVVKSPAGITVVAANAVAGTGTYDVTAALDTLIDRYYHGVAIANHATADVSDLVAYIATMSTPSMKRWPICHLVETASLSTGNTLATTANNMQVVVGNAELFPNVPGEIAAQLCSTLFAETDPASPFDFQELDLYPPAPSDVPTDTEIETAIAAGATILAMNQAGTVPVIVRFVTTKTTVSGAVFENLLDVTNVKTLFYVATQVDTAWLRWQQNKANKKNTASAQKRLRSVTLDVLRQAEELEIIQNVDLHLGELIVEVDAIVKTRLLVGIPVSVVPNLHQLVGVHTLFVE